MREYHNIKLMAQQFVDSHKPTPNPAYTLDINESLNRLDNLDQVDFHALIYQLHTGHFTSTYFSNKHFIRQFIVSFDEHSIPLDIANNLKYGKEEFRKAINEIFEKNT